MIDRREWLRVAGGAAAALVARPLFGKVEGGRLLERAIPSSGERLPVVGLGSSATFSQVARGEDLSALREVIRVMVDRGARVLDTAPSYGASEAVAGRIANELGVARKMFWATKVNVAGRGANAKADPAAARAQIEASLARLKVPEIDLIQVHNLADVPTHLSILEEFKKAGRVRYIGVTTTSKGQYALLQDVMRNEPIDFIGVDYAIDNRDVEDNILPLAAQRKIGVLVYLPFGRTRLFQRVAGHELPEWATTFDASSWAQFFLKYVISHPAVTVVTPATSQSRHMIDNLGGGVGRLPDAATRKRMPELVASL